MNFSQLIQAKLWMFFDQSLRLTFRYMQQLNKVTHQVSLLYFLRLFLTQLIFLFRKFLPLIFDFDHGMVDRVFVVFGFAVLTEVIIADGAFVSHSFYVGLRTYAAGDSLMDAIALVAFGLFRWFGQFGQQLFVLFFQLFLHVFPLPFQFALYVLLQICQPCLKNLHILSVVLESFNKMLTGITSLFDKQPQTPFLSTCLNESLKILL